MSYRGSHLAGVLCCGCVFLILAGFSFSIAGLIWGCNPNVPGGCPLGHPETALVVSGHVGNSECCHRNKNAVCIKYCYPWYLIYSHPYYPDSEVPSFGEYNCTVEQGSEDTSFDAQRKVDGNIGKTKQIVTFDPKTCSTSEGSLYFWWFGVIMLPCLSISIGTALYFLTKKDTTSVSPIPLEPK